VGSIVEATSDTARLREIFKDPELQMVSFTITEKGYNGVIMNLVADLLRDRFDAGAYPLALVSMDNCSRNGERLQNGVLKFADGAFKEYVQTKVSFPWSMIDKITPRPAESVRDALTADGYKGMDIIVTSKGTYIAPFVNAEGPQYLVVEDNFPNGRPPLEKSGVYMTDRTTVEKAERMKVTTCLNPLHTALAVYGCLLGYTTIWEEMKSPELVSLIKRIGYGEGLPVVEHPGIFEPKDFLDEVIDIRLPNPFMPDAPQRIATDTSQKIPIRFGETIKAYGSKANELVGIPLAIAGWLRYLQEPQSPDPRLDELKAKTPEEILRDKTIFGSDLIEIGLGDKILGYLAEIQDKDNIVPLLRKELG
jgi:fructuronate reductase